MMLSRNILIRLSIITGVLICCICAANKETAALRSFAEQSIYLSFDDGPLNGSENIDSVVLAEKLDISVFLVGAHVEKSKALEHYYQLYEHNPFIESYNHSFSHANNHYARFYRNPQLVLADFEQNQTLLQLKHKIARLPGRNSWRIGNRLRNDGKSGIAAADILAQNGYRIFGWDLEWQHEPSTGKPIQTIAEMATAISNKLSQGNTFTKGHIVLLLHDEMFQQRWEESELKQLIDTLKTNKTYRFKHLSQYPIE